MAFFARHLGVHSGQRILGLRMIELLGLLPVRDVVAALAIVTELTLVYILMAARAILRKSQERSGKIFVSYQRTQGGNHMRRRVALFTRHSCMLFDERIAGEAMVELLDGRFPVNERKIFAIVLEVAAHTIFAVRIFQSQLRVVSLIRGQALCNFFVAIETLEGWSTRSELMTAAALC
jgi:hypothetical protein